MNLDRKKGIKENLAHEFGQEKTEIIWQRAKEILAEIEDSHPGLNSVQKMHASYIFPSAAIQKAVKEITGNEEAGYRAISEYSWARSGQLGRKLSAMEKIPGFASFFLKLWDPVSRKGFGPSAGFENRFYPKKKGEYRMDILKCPYHTYFNELGTPELTKIFCINDECMYSALTKLEFIRHSTLGKGGEFCDFMLRIRKEEDR